VGYGANGACSKNINIHGVISFGAWFKESCFWVTVDCPKMANMLWGPLAILTILRAAIVVGYGGGGHAQEVGSCNITHGIV
jgi:hypothetical protein